MNDPIDRAIAAHLSDIARCIPRADGHLDVVNRRGDTSIEGNKIGLLTLGTAAIAEAIGEETITRDFDDRMAAMVPGGWLTWLGTRLIVDEQQIAKARLSARRDARFFPLWVLIFLLMMALVLTFFVIGVIATIMWLL